ncbi:MAG: 4-hydroxy-tetrahydrodipicolinate reductase [Bacteroidales bacterium]
MEQIAISRGHEIVSIIDVSNLNDFESEAFKSADVAIEFTRPDAALDNYRRAFKAGVPVVAGTTGWLDHIDEIKSACENDGKTFFYASNFSLGVNIFFALNKYLAKIMDGFKDYDVSMKEIHHIHKLDEPSGTAISLAEGVLENITRKDNWTLSKEHAANELYIEAIREGEVPGYHSIIYDSPVDTITITHDAKSRKGFALGAVVAAEFTCGKKGFLTMSDMLKF